MAGGGDRGVTAGAPRRRPGDRPDLDAARSHPATAGPEKTMTHERRSAPTARAAHPGAHPAVPSSASPRRGAAATRRGQAGAPGAATPNAPSALAASALDTAPTSGDSTTSGLDLAALARAASHAADLAGRFALAAETAEDHDEAAIAAARAGGAR